MFAIKVPHIHLYFLSLPSSRMDIKLIFQLIEIKTQIMIHCSNKSFFSFVRKISNSLDVSGEKFIIKYMYPLRIHTMNK